RNIQLVSYEQNNLNTYNKQTDSCYDAYGVFQYPFYGKFLCTNDHPTTATNPSIPVFDISNLPPHFKRDLRVELYSVKYMGLSASFKLDNLNPIPYTFNITGDERLKLPCQRNNSDAVAQDGDFYYNFNINTTTIPSTNTYTIFSIIETSAGCTQSYLRVKAIQYNVENCDNTCLQCSGTSTSCTKCDTTCSTLQSSSCVLNNSNYILQEGQCVAACSPPHFNINGKCVWIPNCAQVTSGSIYCTSCQTGFIPVQTNNYEAQCQYQSCPNDYEIVNGICQDKKRNLQGSYLLQALYSFTFSSFELDKNGLIYTKFTNVNNYSSKYTRCGNYQLFGGYFSYRNTSLIATTQFTSTYQYVRVSFKWVLIDYTNTTNPVGLTISVVGSTTGAQSISITGITPSQICGLSANDYVGNFQQDFLVPNGKVTLNILDQMAATISTISTDNDGNFNKFQYFGIRELFIYQFNCLQSNCIACSSVSSGCTQCSQGYYLSNSSCLPCLSDCISCTVGSYCTVCTGGRSLNAQNQCTCASKYYWNGQQCIACSNQSCNTCNTSDSTKCLSCLSNTYLYNSQCLSTCPNQYYKNTTTLTCDQCIANCQQCTNNTSCSLCQPNYYLQPGQNSCLATCPSGYMLNTSNWSCKACTVSNCVSCQADVSQCTQCTANYNLQGTQCQATCNSQYYASNQICLQCSKLFTNCLQCNASSCTQCQNSFYLYQGACTSICPQSYYQDTSTSIAQCTACQNSNCSSCQPASPNCLSCIPSYYLSGQSCVKNCEPNMYPNSSNVCTLCSSLFLGCFSCSSTQCTSCISASDYLDTVNNSCGPTCPVGYFQSITSSSPPINICSACDSNCLNCNSSSTNCISCKSNMYLQGNQCQSSCNQGYFPNSNGICVNCNTKFSNCGQCTANSCSQCQNTYYLVQSSNNCVAFCPQGYATTNSPINQCILCTNTDCKSCNTDLVTCQTCTSTKPYLSNGSCVSQCSSNQYIDSITSTCTNCNSKFVGCQTCTQNSCLSCADSTQYLDITTNTCVVSCDASLITLPPPISQCVQNCATLDPSMTNCILCTNSLGTVTCQLCQNQKVLYQNICQDNCPPGFYANSQNICDSCSNLFQGCNTCTSTICQSCQNSSQYFDPILGQCVSQCQNGANPVSPSTVCQSCTNLSCQTCSTSNLSQCLSCNLNSSNTYLQDGNCVQNCSAQYYVDQNNCLLCSSLYSQQCISCDSTQCQQCSPTYYLSIDSQSCVQVCPQKQYQTQINGIQKCQNCLNTRCSQCDPIAPTKCLSCDQSQTTIYLENSQCNLSCSSTTYPDQSNVCQLCSNLFSNCQQCTSTSCTQCIPNYFLDSASNTCVQTCPPGKYGSSVTNNCEQCGQSVECSVCDSSSPNTCTQCQSSYYLYNSICVAQCPDQTYSDSNNQCQLCTNIQSSCLRCTSGKCTQCIDGDIYLNPLTNLCVSNCPDGYFKYIDTTNGVKMCQQCSNSLCKTCQIDGSCLSCYSTQAQKYLNGTQCDSTCPQYIDDVNNICVNSCNSNQAPDPTTLICELCTNLIYNNQCLTSCPPGTITDPLNSTTCTLCSNVYTNCSQCNSSQCTQCLQGYFELNGNCGLNCPSGMFKDSQTNQCVNSCSQPGYYADATSQSCQQCDLNQCAQCVDNSSKCTKCNNQYYLYQQTNQCYQTCPAQTYLDSLSQQCLQCSQPECLLCDSATKCTQCSNFLNTDDNQCYSSCPSGKFIYQNKCVSSCPQGSFNQSQTNICISCPQNCLNCTSLTNCTSCQQNYQNNYDLTQPQLCDQCVSGFYMLNYSRCKNNALNLNYSIYCNILKSVFLQDDENLSDYNKNIVTCNNSYGQFKTSYYGKFDCAKKQQPSMNSNFGIFQIDNLPPHYRRELRMEIFHMKEINQVNTNLPSTNSVSTFSALEQCNDNDSYLRIRSIQFNIESCHNSCLSCTGPTDSNCSSCDTTCSTLQNQQCILSSSNYVLQEGKCLNTCLIPHFLINNKCVWIPNCMLVNSGNYCTKCKVGFIPVQTENFEAQCQKYCPKDYTNVNGICVDNKINVSGQYLLNSFFHYVFSSYEIEKSKIKVTGQMQVNIQSSLYTRCGDYQLLGGYFSNFSGTQIYTMSYNTQYKLLRVSFKWILIDYNSNQNPNISIQLQGSNTQTQNLSLNGASQQQICGLNTQDYIGDFQYDFNVPTGSFSIVISNQMSNIQTQESDKYDDTNRHQYFGIREYQIYAFNCIQNFCVQCSSQQLNACQKCDIGYYLNNGTCIQCLSECQECQNGTQCTVCKGGKILSPSKICICPSQQFWNGSKCIACQNTTCDTCNTSDSTKCLTCPSNFYLFNQNCSPDCPPLTYKNSNNFTCESCLTNCKTCIDSTSCQVCKPSFYLSADQKNCLTTCPSGYQQNSNSFSCIPCQDSNCQQCQQSTDQCTKCGNNYNLQGGKCQQSCDPTYYSDSFVCKLCSQKYSNCQVCNSTQCLQCLPNYFLYNGTCTNLCPSGYFQDSSSPIQKCTQCSNASCQTCDPSLSSKCLTCSALQYKQGDTCVNTCDSNMFPNSSRICTLCSSKFIGCLSCTSTQCLSCVNSSDYLDKVNNQCGGTCPLGTFKDSSGAPSLNVCTDCDKSCKTCDQFSTQCTSCDNNKYLQGTNCQASCDSNYYPNSERKCIICSSKFPNCTKCTASSCLQCNLPYFFVEGQNNCQSQCPQGYGSITTSVNNTCKQCTNSDCKSCLASNLGLCDSCYPNSAKPYLSGTSCVNQCALNEYIETNTSKCVLCSAKTIGCDTCTETSCKSCLTQYLDLINGKCVDNCSPLKQIESPIKICVQDCAAIDSSLIYCVNCQTDPSNNKICLECENGKYLDQNVCQSSCPDGKYPDSNSICQQCSNKFLGCNKCTGTTCTSCQDASQYYDPVAQKCAFSCEYGANPISPSFICQSCLKTTCKQCSQSNLSQCTSCFSDGLYQYLQDGDCVQNCSSKYYADGLDCKLCSSKIPNCDLCNSDGCLNCSSTYYLSIDKQQCIQPCPDKQYATSIDGVNQCQYCQNSRCLQCDPSQPNLCLSCDPLQNTKYLENGQCNLSCSDHNFPNSQNICQKCESKFQNCNLCSKSTCLLCNTGYYLDVQTQSCVDTCPNGMYGSSLTKQCEFCNQKNECEKCDPQNPNQCSKCVNSLYLQNGFCKIYCDDGTYPDGNFFCQPCSNFDLSCIKCNQNYCTECKAGDIYLDISTKKCVNNCNDGYYKYQDQLTDIKTCEICINPLCKTCQADGSCLSCFTYKLEQYLNGDKCTQTCPKYIDENYKLCVESCPSNQVPDKNTQKCTICNQKIYNLECLANCPIGTIEDPSNSSLCVLCKNVFSNCDVCDQNNCQICLPNNFLSNGKCVKDCPLNTYKNYQTNECVQSCSQSGYFADQNSKSCLQCNTNTCAECVDTKDKCTKCVPDKFFYESQNQCYQNCPQKTYGDINSKQCLSCDQKTCLKCEGSVKCLQCSDYLNEDDHKCYQDCPQGKYKYQHRCVDSCPLGQYLDQLQNTCFNCPENCEECVQKNLCTKCLPNYMNNLDKLEHQICDQCIEGYYLQNGICLKCSNDCKTCQNSSSECLTCPQGYNLDFLKQCVICSQDEYFDEILRKCLIKQTGGIIPKLYVFDEILQKDNKILIQAKITFSEEIFVVEPKWNMSLDSIQNNDYDIKYDIVQEKENSLRFNSKEIKKQIQKLKVLISITIEKNASNQYKQLSVDFINNNNIIQSQNFGLKIIKLQENLPEYSIYKYPQVSKSTEISSALIGTSYFALVLGAPFYMLVSFFDILQLTNYLLYLNVQYQDTLYSVIKLFDFANFEFIPNIKKENSNSPFKFRMEKIDTFIYSNLIQSIVIWLFSFLIYILNRNIQLITNDYGNLSTYIKNVVPCDNSYGQFDTSYYANFQCVDKQKPAMNSNYGIFEIDDLPPHYRREVRIEIFHNKESKIQLNFQLDNLTPVSVQFDKGSLARLQIPCQSKSGNSYDTETEYFYNCKIIIYIINKSNYIKYIFQVNQVNTNLPATNSVSTFSVLEKCSDSVSYLRIRSIQFNIEFCHNSCLSCTGPTQSNCVSCDSTCATLQNQSVLIVKLLSVYFFKL
ncbi:hypothetical protein ABPG73_011750, partial [Tetrahymena malaccensis]